MFHIIKYLFYLVVVAGIIFLFWFLPKYSFVKKNPSFCTNLTKNIYYCGSSSEAEKLFKTQNDNAN
jgi:hypothetical protein